MAKRFGVMIDMSRNAVTRPEELKRMIKILSDFGYNMVQLYTEDTYEVEGEPYFGYLRGRYSIDDIRDIVEYAEGVGVEVIPCIQTLAHLNCIFMWSKYKEINDTGDILLADDERTYELIENMFRTIRKCYKTDVVHIGMDEAFMLGLGNHLAKYGFENRFDILSRHLARVIEIAKKYSFKPIMWSDMFFRLANGGNYYDWNNITDEVIASCPDGVDLVYWDYYHNEKSFYDGMIAAHNRFGTETWFAGGIWTWAGIAPHATFSNDSMEKAMISCREQNVENIMMTLWGDNGRECSIFAVLPSLYRVKKIYDGVTDEEEIRRGFNEITGEDYDAMMDLELPNMVAGNNPMSPSSVYKAMLFSDPFFGFADPTVKDGVAEQYAAHKRTLTEHAKHSKNYGYLFELAIQLCSVMEIKYDLGVRTRKAYKAGDRATLTKLAEEYIECAYRTRKLHNVFSIAWHKENRPHGFDVHDVRYGGLAARIEACGKRLGAYLDGKIDRLEELEEELLPFDLALNNMAVIDGTPGTEGLPNIYGHSHIDTVNRRS